MQLIPVVIAVVFGLLIVATFAGFAGFGLRLRRYHPGPVLDSQLTEAAVILSLRGGDASLRKMLDQLATQKYPRYRIYVVVDHPRDPALPVVRQWRDAQSDVPVQVEFLHERLPHCTLKFSAIRQVLARLPRQIGAVVFVDGDADPYANWLRDLITPLALDENVGAVTGNRWYFPPRGGLGSWIRFFFTGCSLPFMEKFGYAWGGSLAVRRDVVDQLQLNEEFSQVRSATEEQAVFAALRTTGHKQTFSPHVVLWNRDGADAPDSLQFVTRQLFWGRFYFPNRDLILGYAVMTCACAAAAAYGGYLSLTSEVLGTAWKVVFALGVVYWAVIVGSLAWIHRLLRVHVMPRQGRMLPPLTLKRLAALFLSAPPALLVNAVAAVKARLARFVEWRGVRYEVDDRMVRLAAYRPLADTAPRPQKQRARASVPGMA